MVAAFSLVYLWTLSWETTSAFLNALFLLCFLLLPWAEDELHLVTQGGAQQKITALLAWKRRDGTFSLFSAIFNYRMSICASMCSVGRPHPPGKVFKCCKVRAEGKQAALLMLRSVLLFHLTQGYLTFSAVVTALPFGKKSSQVSPWDVSMHLSWFFFFFFISRIKYRHLSWQVLHHSLTQPLPRQYEARKALGINLLKVWLYSMHDTHCTLYH